MNHIHIRESENILFVWNKNTVKYHIFDFELINRYGRPNQNLIANSIATLL